ncbi:MAG: serine/threonine-protein kinase [Planctomycetota bacterium]
MNSSRRALDLFEILVSLPPAEREVRLIEQCADDPALRREVGRMLVADDLLQGDPTSTPRVELDEGARVGDYRILATLGRGAHGVVYRARQSYPERDVALKILHGNGMSTQRRFAAEITTLARLQHPHIVQFYAAGSAVCAGGPVSYLAMEIVDGGCDLRAFLQSRRLTVRERVELLVKLADALEHAHQRAVLHRDLKPENILVALSSDGSGRPMIVDFGVARACEAEAFDGTVDAFVGTPAYSAPETLGVGVGMHDVRADVYSLGVVAFETLAGEAPTVVPGSDAVVALLQRSRAPARRLRDVVPRLGRELDQVMAMALASDPARRYQSARAFGDDLRAWLRCEPVLARRGGSIYRVCKFVQRRPAISALLVASLLLLFSVFGVWEVRNIEGRRTLRVVQVVLKTAIDGLDRLPSTAKLRGACLDDLWRDMEPLADRRSDDSLTSTVLANLVRARANVERDLGNWSAAAELRRRGLAVRQSLFERDSSPVIESDLATDLVLMGDVWADQGDYEAARPWYEDAHSHFAALAGAHPDDRRLVDDYGCSLDRLSGLITVLGDSGSLGGNDALLTERARVNAILQVLAPHHQATLLGENSYWAARADQARAQGDSAAQFAYLQGCMATARELVARYGGERLAQLRLVIAARRLASAALEVGRPEEARAVLDEARAPATAVFAWQEGVGIRDALFFDVVDAETHLVERHRVEASRLAREVVDYVAAHPKPFLRDLGARAANVAETAASGR